MPHPPRDSRTFETKSGRAEFVASPIDVLQVPDGHLVLQTLRSHDQFNTTIYGLSDRYRGIEGGRKVIFLHRDDITHLGFANGDFVDIVTHWDRRRPRHACAGIPDRRVRHAARFGRRVLPGDKSAGAAGLHGTGQQLPDVEVDHRLVVAAAGSPPAGTWSGSTGERAGRGRRRLVAQEPSAAGASLLTERVGLTGRRSGPPRPICEPPRGRAGSASDWAQAAGRGRTSGPLAGARMVRLDR